jgi:hypothetical protein
MEDEERRSPLADGMGTCVSESPIPEIARDGCLFRFCLCLVLPHKSPLSTLLDRLEATTEPPTTRSD